MAPKSVVVSGDVDDRRSLARLAQDLLDNVVVSLRPVPSPPQLPPVDNVADEVQIRGFGVTKEVEKQRCLARRAAQVKSEIQIVRKRSLPS